MKKASRHESRECLLQALYGRSVLGESFSLPEFLSSYYDERFENLPKDAYFVEAFSGIVSKEAELASVVHRFAPKFNVSMMPVVNLLPIFIAAYEMLYLESDPVPEKVSIDEAIELTKRFSDDSSRTLVNGVLNSLKEELEAVKSDLSTGSSTLPKPGIF